MPVFLAIIANIRDRSAPWQTLALPLILIAIGVGIVNVATIGATNASNTASVMLGILASTAALAIWIAYGLANAAVMRSADAPDGFNGRGFRVWVRRSEAFYCYRWLPSICRLTRPLQTSFASSHGRS
jgi:hypothetical protein